MIYDKVCLESGKFIDANSQFCTRHGVSREELLSGYHWKQFCKKEDINYADGLLRQMRNGQVEQFALIQRIKVKDGQYSPTLICLNVMQKDSKGIGINVICILLDLKCFGNSISNFGNLETLSLVDKQYIKSLDYSQKIIELEMKKLESKKKFKIFDNASIGYLICDNVNIVYMNYKMQEFGMNRFEKSIKNFLFTDDDLWNREIIDLLDRKKNFIEYYQSKKYRITGYWLGEFVVFNFFS